MFNMYFSAIDLSKGYPIVAGQKIIPFNGIGDFESVQNICIDLYAESIGQLPVDNVFLLHNNEFTELAAMLSDQEDLRTAEITQRVEHGKTKRLVLSVHCLVGDDIPRW